MEENDFIPRFSECPYCGDKSYESLKTHSHCFSCQNSPTFNAQPNYAVPAWAFEQLARTNTIPGIGKNRGKVGD